MDPQPSSASAPPVSSPEPAPPRPVLPEDDPDADAPQLIHTALTQGKPADRVCVREVFGQICSLESAAAGTSVYVQASHTYHRLLCHKAAAMCGLSHETRDTAVMITRTGNPPATQDLKRMIAEADEQMKNAEPAPVKSVKIMRRGEGNTQTEEESAAAAAAAAASKEAARSAKSKTERKETYEEARLRILGSAHPPEEPPAPAGKPVTITAPILAQPRVVGADSDIDPVTGLTWSDTYSRTKKPSATPPKLAASAAAFTPGAAVFVPGAGLSPVPVPMHVPVGHPAYPQPPHAGAYPGARPYAPLYPQHQPPQHSPLHHFQQQPFSPHQPYSPYNPQQQQQFMFQQQQQQQQQQHQHQQQQYHYQQQQQQQQQYYRQQQPRPYHHQQQQQHFQQQHYANHRPQGQGSHYGKPS